MQKLKNSNKMSIQKPNQIQSIKNDRACLNCTVGGVRGNFQSLKSFDSILYDF